MDFQPYPLRPFGDLKKIPSATPPGPRTSAPAAVPRFVPLFDLRTGPQTWRGALGDFSNPIRTRGIWAKIPSTKSEFSKQIQTKIYLELM